MSATEIAKLSPDERLDLIAELWDSLSVNERAAPLTAAQRQELDFRLDDLENGGTAGIPWETAVADIGQRLK